MKCSDQNLRKSVANTIKKLMGVSFQQVDSEKNAFSGHSYLVEKRSLAQSPQGNLVEALYLLSLY